MKNECIFGYTGGRLQPVLITKDKAPRQFNNSPHNKFSTNLHTHRNSDPLFVNEKGGKTNRGCDIPPSYLSKLGGGAELGGGLAGGRGGVRPGSGGGVKPGVGGGLPGVGGGSSRGSGGRRMG